MCVQFILTGTGLTWLTVLLQEVSVIQFSHQTLQISSIDSLTILTMKMLCNHWTQVFQGLLVSFLELFYNISEFIEDFWFPIELRM